MNRTVEEIATAVGGKLVQGNPGAPVAGVSTDSRTCKAGEVFFALVGEKFDGHDFVADVLARGAAGAVVSRDVSAGNGFLIRVDDTTAALGRLAADHRLRMPAFVVGVTGSNGKTTTKEMIYHVLSAALPGTKSAKSFNNSIGVPLTLLSIEPQHKFAVVEIGTNHPGEVRMLTNLARPDIAVITSVAPSHLEGLGSVEAVMDEEADGVLGLREGGTAIINADVPGLVECVGRKLGAGRKLVTFGRNPTADVRLTHVRTNWDGSECEVNGNLRFRLPVPGPHNAVNALAAVAVGLEAGLPREQIAARFADFVLPGQRLQQRQAGSITLINDSYNANPGSMAAALEVLRLAPDGRRRVFCAGDMLELGPAAPDYHRKLGEQAAAAGVGLLVAVGPMAGVTAEGALHGGLAGERVQVFPDSRRAAGAVGSWLKPTDFVLVKGSRGVKMEAVADAVCEARM